MLLQIQDTAEIVRQAGEVKPGDYSGYTFAVVLLVVMLLVSLTALKKLWDENKILQTSAVTRAEDMTKSLIQATNAQERAFEKVAEKLEHQTELLKEIKALKA
jgi:hypothetical protein